MDLQAKHFMLFLASFLVGCFVIYYSPMEYKTVFVYPKPSNVKKLQYKGTDGSCVTFRAVEAECGPNVSQYPS